MTAFLTIQCVNESPVCFLSVIYICVYTHIYMFLERQSKWFHMWTFHLLSCYSSHNLPTNFLHSKLKSIIHVYCQKLPKDHSFLWSQWYHSLINPSFLWEFTLKKNITHRCVIYMHTWTKIWEKAVLTKVKHISLK